MNTMSMWMPWEIIPTQESYWKQKKALVVTRKQKSLKKWCGILEGDELNMIEIPLEGVREIINLNNKGKLPDKLEDFAQSKEAKSDFENAADKSELSRFDRKK